MLTLTILLVGLAALSRAESIFSDRAPECNSLATKLTIANASINFVDYVPAGTNLTFNSTGDFATCSYAAGQVVPVDICRVSMWVATSNRSGEQRLDKAIEL